jgi:hypothetical protein
MPSLLKIRADNEADLREILEKLDRRHKARVRAALEQYGSVQAIPYQFWENMQREIEDETAEAFLLLIAATDQWTTDQIRRQGVVMRGAGGQGLIDYSRLAAAQAQRMAQETTRTLRGKLAAKIATAPEDVRGAVDDVFTPERAERIARAEVVRGSSFGEIVAGQRASGFGGDGASTADGQRVRIDLIWMNHPEQSRSGPCPICEPLHGTSQSEWSQQFPAGPPSPHLGCVCTLDPRVIVLSEAEQ